MRAYQFLIPTDNKPTMPLLRNLRLNSGRTLDLVSEIGTSSRKFGHLLLENSNEVNIIEMTCQHFGPKCVVDHELSDWMNGKGRLPVTWETLIQVIHDTGLKALASDLRGQYLSSRNEL